MAATVTTLEISVDKKQICRRLGYWNSNVPRHSILSLIDECIEESELLMEPSCLYQVMDIQRIRRPKVTLINGTSMTISSEVLSWVLYPCEQAVVFLCSIGAKLEERISVLNQEGSLIKAMILDAVGSEAVESLAGCFQQEIQRIANKAEAEITRRYSPGYCDWDIKQQKLIFKNLESELIHMSLSNECLMNPRKSISGIFGIGWEERRRMKASPCQFCSNQECNNRR